MYDNCETYEKVTKFCGTNVGHFLQLNFIYSNKLRKDISMKNKRTTYITIRLTEDEKI